mmetsp:Transcript_31020/g.47420  ORF Transcript_31020/g.47420 Transcript_31020/m.47420 type:complete len:113 (+) Transcript_31020:2453-2791(+)
MSLTVKKTFNIFSRNYMNSRPLRGGTGTGGGGGGSNSQHRNDHSLSFLDSKIGDVKSGSRLMRTSTKNFAPDRARQMFNKSSTMTKQFLDIHSPKISYRSKRVSTQSKQISY